MYTNQQYDKESGLYYYNARYYDPHLGSFITPDPAMDGLNHYNYCFSNPVRYTDPTGLYTDYSDPSSAPTHHDDPPDDDDDNDPNDIGNNGSGDSGDDNGTNQNKPKNKPKNNNPNNPDNNLTNDKKAEEINELQFKLKYDKELSEEEKKEILSKIKEYYSPKNRDSGAIQSDPIIFEMILAALGAEAVLTLLRSINVVVGLKNKAVLKNKQEPEFNLQRFAKGGEKIGKGKDFNPWKDTKTGTKDVSNEMIKLRDAAEKAASLKKSSEATDLADAFDAVISNKGLTRIISGIKNWFKNKFY